MKLHQYALACLVLFMGLNKTHIRTSAKVYLASVPGHFEVNLLSEDNFSQDNVTYTTDKEALTKNRSPGPYT